MGAICVYFSSRSVPAMRDQVQRSWFDSPSASDDAERASATPRCKDRGRINPIGRGAERRAGSVGDREQRRHLPAPGWAAASGMGTMHERDAGLLGGTAAHPASNREARLYGPQVHFERVLCRSGARPDPRFS